jgi:hypothetical protein
VAFLEFAEVFNGAEQHAESRKIDLGRVDGDFVAPDFAGSVVARFDDFLGGESSFGGVGGFVDDAEKANSLGGLGEAFSGEVVADLGVGR